jgi:hypothetical protein
MIDSQDLPLDEMSLGSKAPARKIPLPVIRLIDLYRVVGRRLTRKLIEARWIVPAQNGASGLAFELEEVLRALGRLTREGYTLLPRPIFLPTERRAAGKNAPSLENILLDEEELARLAEE